MKQASSRQVYIDRNTLGLNHRNHMKPLFSYTQQEVLVNKSFCRNKRWLIEPVVYLPSPLAPLP